MKRTNMAIIAVVAVVVIVCAAFAYATQDDIPSGDDGRFDYELIPVTDDMREWPTADESRASWETAVEAFRAASSEEGADVGAALADLQGAVDELERHTLFANQAYYLDIEAYGDAYEEYTVLLAEASAELDDVLREALEGPNGEAFRQVLGDEEADRLLDTTSAPPGFLELSAREAELSGICVSTDDPLTAAECFLELIDVRNEIAALYGYDSYPEYAYAMLNSRDYTPADTDAVRDVLKEYMDGILDVIANADSDGFRGLFSYTEQDGLFDAAEPFIDSICPEFAEVYDYLREYGLIDFEDLDNKMPGAVTVSGGGLSFIVADPSGDAKDLDTLVHEFGHAASALLSGEMQDNDVAEIQSQGLEALLALNPGTVFGESPETYTEYLLSDLLSVILNAFAIDELEQRAYAGEADTPEELVALRDEVYAEYGMTSVHDEWYVPNHLYYAPLYYISYAVSAFNALEIFVDGLEDYDAAVDEYLDVVAWTENGYIGMTEALGMGSIFDPDDFAAVIGASVDHALA